MAEYSDYTRVCSAEYLAECALLVNIRFRFSTVAENLSGKNLCSLVNASLKNRENSPG
jgi:hypothetical protein